MIQIAVLVFICVAVYVRRSVFRQHKAALVGLGVLALVGLGSLFVQSVPANSIGIPTLFGKVGSPLRPGIHLVAPWTEVTTFTTRVQELSMLRANDEGDKAKDDSISVIASGGGAMSVDLTVRYALDDSQASDLFRQAGTMELVKERFVRPDSREVTRNVFGQYVAEEGYATKRGEISAAIAEQLRPRLAERGILLDSVNVRDVLPEQRVLDAINSVLAARNQATQAFETQKQKVTEAETAAKVAKAEAEARLTRARAEADAALLTATAQAEANTKVAASLSPQLAALQTAQACANAIAATKAAVVTCGANNSSTAATPASVIVDQRS